MNFIKSFLLCECCIHIYTNEWFFNRKNDQLKLLEDSESTIYFKDIYLK